MHVFILTPTLMTRTNFTIGIHTFYVLIYKRIRSVYVCALHCNLRRGIQTGVTLSITLFSLVKENRYVPKVDKSRYSTNFQYGRVLDSTGVLNKDLFMYHELVSVAKWCLQKSHCHQNFCFYRRHVLQNPKSLIYQKYIVRYSPFILKCRHQVNPWKAVQIILTNPLEFQYFWLSCKSMFFNNFFLFSFIFLAMSVLSPSPYHPVTL